MAVPPARAIVLLSGGLDSAVALAWARRQDRAVLALTFEPPRRPRGERRAVDGLLAWAPEVRSIRLPVGFVTDAFVSKSPPVAAPEGYVPARNLVYYSLALHVAESQEAGWVVGGHTAEDAETFPDVSSRFFASLSALAAESTLVGARTPASIVQPLQAMRKHEVVRQGVAWDVPLGRTWTCIVDGPVHCGRCGGCRDRQAAFAKADVPDPTSYAAGDRFK
ncbi:MAG TPA: 7-cyano-7-deazaguanine synthase [Candidatus Thermoplasmatota archaeon]|nr:7-cyano-7-deazaguanine synthase [Candidatus Thermoplasmatota archaeon]